MTNSMSVKFQIFSQICMSNSEFNSASELREAVQTMFDYITEGVDLDNNDKEDNVIQLVN